MRRPLLSAALLLPLLAGCDAVVLSPSGYIADQQRDLLITSTLLMLIIVIPVMGLTAFFAWRYNEKRRSRYEPEWSHSTSLELVIWAAPLAIIICLGAITWVGTHLLDPYRALVHVADRRPVPENTPPLEVQVVALDWKWLFIYPEYGIATVNDAAAPVDRPIEFHLTSQSVMNAFYVPALAGMIYAMPSMQSNLHAVINVPGEYEGFSSNYSGAGFSNMRFAFHGLQRSDFDVWIAKARLNGEPLLDRARYLELAEPSADVEPMAFGDVDPDLFRRIVNRCVEQGRLCVDEMMALDAQGGTGLAGLFNTIPVEGQPSALGHTPFYVAEFCTPADSVARYGEDSLVRLDPAPLPAADDAGREETL
jgi:cytochrome o ubiquinol oxidase subunit II